MLCPSAALTASPRPWQNSQSSRNSSHAVVGFRVAFAATSIGRSWYRGMAMTLASFPSPSRLNSLWRFSARSKNCPMALSFDQSLGRWWSSHSK